MANTSVCYENRMSHPVYYLTCLHYVLTKLNILRVAFVICFFIYCFVHWESGKNLQSAVVKYHHWKYFMCSWLAWPDCMYNKNWNVQNFFYLVWSNLCEPTSLWTSGPEFLVNLWNVLNVSCCTVTNHPTSVILDKSVGVTSSVIMSGGYYIFIGIIV